MKMPPIASRLPLALSALVGGVVCALADLVQKSEASAVLLIGRTLDGLFPGVSYSPLIAIVLILILAVAFSLIFESPTKKAAFYLGASVLAILMTLTPYKIPDGFKTIPHSVEVSLSVSNQSGSPVEGALVTLWDASGKTVLARTKMRGSQFRFYQAGGSYKLTVEASGYETAVHRLSLREGSPLQPVSISLRPSSTPLFIQRILR